MSQELCPGFMSVIGNGDVVVWVWIFQVWVFTSAFKTFPIHAGNAFLGLVPLSLPSTQIHPQQTLRFNGFLSTNLLSGNISTAGCFFFFPFQCLRSWKLLPCTWISKINGSPEVILEVDFSLPFLSHLPYFRLSLGNLPNDKTDNYY